MRFVNRCIINSEHTTILIQTQTSFVVVGSTWLRIKISILSGLSLQVIYVFTVDIIGFQNLRLISDHGQRLVVVVVAQWIWVSCVKHIKILIIFISNSDLCHVWSCNIDVEFICYFWQIEFSVSSTYSFLFFLFSLLFLKFRLGIVHLFYRFSNSSVLLLKQMIPTLDIFIHFITLYDWNFKINTSKLYDIVNFNFVILVFSFKLFENIVTRTFVS